MNKKLINKNVLNDIIANSNICQHAIKELKLAGYGKGEGGPNDWIYQQVLEAVAIFSSHDNWIMAVDINDLDLTYLSLSYDIQWKNCFCMKDICLEDVTPELKKRLLKKLKIINNK